MIYGVLLFENAWQEIGTAIEPYQKEGHVGKYLYCNELKFDCGFAVMTFYPDKLRISSKMTIHVPISFIKFIAHSVESEPEREPIGFR